MSKVDDYTKGITYNINQQLIRFKLIPLDKNLSEIQEETIEVNSYFVQNLSLNLESDGFQGEIDFIYPYETQYAKSLEIINTGLPCKLIIELSHVYSLEDNIRSKLKDSHDLSNEQIKLTAYIGGQLPKSCEISEIKYDVHQNNAPATSYQATYKLTFCDAIQFFWKEHKPISLYSSCSYEDVINEQNQNFSNFIKIDMLDNSEDAFKVPLPFIAVNAGQNYQDGFYGYMQNILNAYNSILIYDYISDKYILTRALENYFSDKKKINNIYRIDKQALKAFSINYIKPLLKNSRSINTHIESSDQPTSINWLENNNNPKVVDSLSDDILTEHDIPLLYSLQTDAYKLNRKFNIENQTISLDIPTHLPISYSILPNENIISLEQSEWEIIFGDYGNSLRIDKCRLTLNKYSKYKGHKILDYITTELYKNDQVNKDYTSFDFEDRQHKKGFIPLLFEPSCKLTLTNSEAWTYSKPIEDIKPINVMGKIFTTNSDAQEETKNSILFKYTKTSSEVTAVNNTYNSDKKIAGIDNNSEQRPRYQTIVSSKLWSPSVNTNEQIMPVDLMLSGYSHFLSYLKAGSIIDVSIYPEHAELVGIKQYQAPDEDIVNGIQAQTQGIIFEDNNKQKTTMLNTYKADDDSSLFKITHTPKSKGTPSYLQIDNDTFEISIDCNDE